MANDNKSINLGHGVGRRKTSVARVYLRDGNGKVTINGNVQLNGQEVATGDVKDNTAISLATHTHTGNLGTPTSPPL